MQVLLSVKPMRPTSLWVVKRDLYNTNNGAAVAEWGMVAASCGMELMSGSGVLLGGDIASGVITILGLSCRGESLCLFLSTLAI